MTRQIFDAYGLRFSTAESVRAPVPHATEVPDFEFVLESGARPHEPPSEAVAIPYRTHAGPTQLHAYRGHETTVLFFESVGEFEIGAERVVCRPEADARPIELELTFLGPVLAVVCSLRGRLALHAAGVSLGTPRRGIGFLAGSRAGKTSLACSLMQRGAELLTDDILVIDPSTATVYPAWPQVRLWPETATHFYGSSEGLPKVSPAFDKRRGPVGQDGIGGFSSESVTLTRLYQPVREMPDEKAANADFELLGKRDAARELLANSFAARTLTALGHASGHLDSCLELLEHLDVHRITYPDGLEHLPAVSEAIWADATAPLRPRD